MAIPLPPWFVLDPFIERWLQEDIGRGDWTTMGLFPESSPLANAFVLLKEPGVACGLPLVERIFWHVDHQLEITLLAQEGVHYPSRTDLVQIKGSSTSILIAERVALNLMQRLSGIATSAHQYVTALANTHCKLTDTRKTTPGLRILEKYAMRVGGAINHRLGLDDAVMIKDNHIVAAGSVQAAVEQIRKYIPHLLSIEVECDNLAQVKEALAMKVDMILLDNMTLSQLEEAVQLVQGQILLEASGRVTLDNLQQVAATGVNYIATSAPITRSRWLDISLDFR